MTKFKFLLLSTALWFLPFAIHAQEEESAAANVTTADIKAAMDERREISLAPSAGYTEENGWLYGVKGSIAFPMTLRSQIELGGILLRKADDDADRDASGIFAGPVYNFSSQYKQAFFAGLGIGYSNIYPFERETNPDERLVYGFAQVGKRFALGKKGKFSYKPRFQYFARGGSDGDQQFQVDALNFSYLF